MNTLLIAGCLGAGLFSPVQDTEWPAPIDLEIRGAMIPFAAADKVNLVYELHVTNMGLSALKLTRVEALGGQRIQDVLVSYQGKDLDRVLYRPGLRKPKDRKRIGPGLRAIVYMWIKREPEADPLRGIRHRLTFESERVRPIIGGGIHLQRAKPVSVGSPLRGGNWICGNGPDNLRGHRRVLLSLGGRMRGAQRFAIDFIQVRENGLTYKGDAKKNSSYYAYGKEVLAVASGRIVAVKDQIPENVPGAKSRAVKMTPETAGGNYVVLEVAPGQYAFYAHLQPGKIRVETGEVVKEGQVLGLVGNSGNSTEPHLHFHVGDKPSPLGAEGVPYVFRGYRHQGVTLRWQSAILKKGKVRSYELPLNNAIVRFE